MMTNSTKSGILQFSGFDEVRIEPRLNKYTALFYKVLPGRSTSTEVRLKLSDEVAQFLLNNLESSGRMITLTMTDGEVTSVHF